MKPLALPLLVVAALLPTACGAKEKGAVPSPAKQANGLIIYSLSQGSGGQPEFENCPGLWTVNPDGTDLRLIAPDDSSNPTLSPDGRRLALFLEGEGEAPDIWTMDLTDGGVRRLVKSLQVSAQNYPWFRWSPAGDELLLVRTVRGRDEIARIDAKTGEATVLVEAGKGELAFPAWSPDGSQIAYSYITDKAAEIWLIAPNGGKRHKLVDGLSPVWFPDSTRIAFFDSNHLYEDGPLRAVDVGGGKETLLTEAVDAGPSSVQWSPDGKSFLFLREAKKRDDLAESDVFRLDLEGNHEELVATNAEPAGWSPAGDLILFSKPFPPGEVTVVGIYTSKPDGSDTELVGVNDEDDVMGQSEPVWRPAAKDIVAPPAFAKFNARSACPARLARLRARFASRNSG